jgi:hypothetical protein
LGHAQIGINLRGINIGQHLALRARGLPGFVLPNTPQEELIEFQRTGRNPVARCARDILNNDPRSLDNQLLRTGILSLRLVRSGICLPGEIQ